MKKGIQDILIIIALAASLVAMVFSFIALVEVGAHVSVVDFEPPEVTSPYLPPPSAGPLDPDVAVDNYNRAALRLCPECETLKHCNWSGSHNDTDCLLENLAIIGRNDDRVKKIMGR